MVDDDFDFGVAGDDGFDGGVVFAFAKEVESEVEVAGAFPEGVLVYGSEVCGVAVAREVNANAAKALFGGKVFELVGGIGSGGIYQGLGGEFVGVLFDAVGDVVVVEEVVNGLDYDGFFDAGLGHCFKEEFDGAGLVGGAWAVGIFFSVVTPNVEMGIDDHGLTFRCVLQNGVNVL